MINDLYARLKPLATVRNILISIVLCIVCIIGFNFRDRKIDGNVSLLDGRLIKERQIWYSPADVQALFSSLGEENLRLYWITGVTLDVLFPIFYVSVFVFLLIRFYSERNARFLILIPILAGVFDLLENFTIAYLAITYNGQPSAVSNLAAFFSLAKWTMFLLSFTLAIVGGVKLIGKKLRQKN